MKMAIPLRRRIIMMIGVLVLAPTIGAGAWALGLRLTGNIHIVAEGKVWRSAQLSPNSLKTMLSNHGIKTVINLRGSHPEEEWYRAERAATDALGVQHISLPLSATIEPDDETLQALVLMMQKVELPLLIHCEAGADRSGLASALYRLIIEGDKPADASSQLSFRFGHFPWGPSRTGAMDRAFWRVAAAPEKIKPKD